MRMKSSPLIDISFSSISTGIIACLFYLKPNHFELFVIGVPLALSLLFIGLSYLGALFPITSYGTLTATKNLKTRKKFLHACLNDQNLTAKAKQEYLKEYEEVTKAIAKWLRN